MTRDDTALPGYLSRPLTDLVHKDANGLYPHEEALNALDPGQRDFIKAAYLAWVKDKRPSVSATVANNCVRKLICMGYEVPKKYLEAVRTARVMQGVEKTKEPLFSKAATTRNPEQLESTEPPQFDFNAANANPVSELAQRELCRRRLLPFILRFRPNYLAGWVHKDICRRVERFVERVERKESPRLLLMMPPRSGKLLADDTLVPTPRGYRFHGDLLPGDEVFHPSGKTVQVVAVSQKGVADVRVGFSDGSSYLCHENHEWTLFDRKRGAWKTLEAGHFLRQSHLGRPPKLLNGARSIYQLPTVAPLEYRNSFYTLHPYVLGAWLGDGSAGKPCITGAKSDRAIIDKIESLGYPVSAVCTHKTTGVITTYFSGPKPNNSGRMTLELQGLRIYKQKRIPIEYQHLRIELRLELLAGIVDTDGTTDEKSRITITTVSRELADDIMRLCEGLGMRPYIQEVQPTLSSSGIQGRKVCYVVGFQPTTELPVALERKRVTRIAQQRRVALVSVERVADTQQGNCIQVDSPDGLYVIGTKMTVTHNSEVLSRNTPAWILGKHPDWELIACSHTGSLTLEFSRYIRDLLRDPAYTAVFPATVLNPQSQSVESWNTTKGGGYLAAGLNGGITGRGAHCLIVDDVVKDYEAAQSATQRDAAWTWWTSTAYTRLAPGGGVIALMTNWHADDWAGRIQDTMTIGGEVYEVIKFPAINEYGDEYLLPDDTIIQVAEKEPVPEGARLTRPRGTALHPERYTTEALLRIKNNLVMSGQKAVWDALYQQNPIPDEGDFFSKDMFRYYSTAPQRSEMYVYQAWDFAISTGKESDYTVGTTIGVDHRDNAHVLDVRRFKSGDGILIAEYMVDYAKEYRVDALGVEDGQIWKALESQFLKACTDKRYFPSYEVLKTLTDKKVRAAPLRGRMQAGKVFFDKDAHWFPVQQKELLHFPNVKNDDCHTFTTIVECPHGQIMIGMLKDGDKILSYDGKDVVVREVLQHHCTGVKEVIELSFSDGVTLELTPSHPVLTERGYVYAGDLTTQDNVVRKELCRYRNTASSGQRSVQDTTSPQQTFVGCDAGYTATLTSRSAGSFRTSSTFTTSTATRTTMSHVTSNAYLAPGTWKNTGLRLWSSATQLSSSLISRLLGRLRLRQKLDYMLVDENCERTLLGIVRAAFVSKYLRLHQQVVTRLRTALQDARTRLITATLRPSMQPLLSAHIVGSLSCQGHPLSGENCIAQPHVATSTDTKTSISHENALRVGSATISKKVRHLRSVRNVSTQAHQKIGTSVLAAGERLYPESRMVKYSAIESVLTSIEDLAVTQRASKDSSRVFVKVVSIRQLGYQKTYNFEVSGTRNFLVEGGIVVHNCVDSLAWSIRLTLTRTPPQVRTPPPQKSWRDKLKDHIGGGAGVGSHMSA